MILSGIARPLLAFKEEIMSRREWWGIGAATACYALSFVVLGAGGPYIVGAKLGATMWAQVPTLMMALSEELVIWCKKNSLIQSSLQDGYQSSRVSVRARGRMRAEGEAKVSSVFKVSPNIYLTFLYEICGKFFKSHRMCLHMHITVFVDIGGVYELLSYGNDYSTRGELYSAVSECMPDVVSDIQDLVIFSIERLDCLDRLDE